MTVSLDAARLFRTVTMKANVSHTVWYGEVNLMATLAKKEIVAQGPVTKILKLRRR